MHLIILFSLLFGARAGRNFGNGILSGRNPQLTAKVLEAGRILPVVLWHGMGDKCDDPDSMGAVAAATSDALRGAFVHSICLADGDKDRTASYLGNINEQIDQVCETLSAIPQLKGGFNAVGFSQGGLFLRALVERCDSIKIHRLVTLGSPHQGVTAVPQCPPLPSKAQTAGCKSSMALVRTGAYWEWVQRKIIQSTYFKDPSNYEKYLAKSILLADVNNERENKTASYKANLAALDMLVLFKFDEDTVLVPAESAWFSDLTTDGPLPMGDSRLYKEDFIGLQKLDREGRIVFDIAPGEHMRFSLEWYLEAVVLRYLVV